MPFLAPMFVNLWAIRYDFLQKIHKGTHLQPLGPLGTLWGPLWPPWGHSGTPLWHPFSTLFAILPILLTQNHIPTWFFNIFNKMFIKLCVPRHPRTSKIGLKALLFVSMILIHYIFCDFAVLSTYFCQCVLNLWRFSVKNT